jgi:hypothetical protein
MVLRGSRFPRKHVAAETGHRGRRSPQIQVREQVTAESDDQEAVLPGCRSFNNQVMTPSAGHRGSRLSSKEVSSLAGSQG